MGDDETMFDPFSIKSISQKLGQALTDTGFRTRLIENGAKRANLFSWDGCATKTIEALQQVVNNKPIFLNENVQITNTKLFSPVKNPFSL